MRVLESIDEIGVGVGELEDGGVDGGKGGIDDDETLLRVIGSPSSWSTPPTSPPRSGTNTPFRSCSYNHNIPFRNTVYNHNTPSRCY